MSKSPSSSPTTKTYQGGQRLPALSTSFRAVQIGRTPNGKYAQEQRAFLLVIENTSISTDMFVELGGGDEFRIAPSTTHKITSTDGRASVRLRASTSGFTNYQIKSLEAHNSFNLQDKAEAFIQSISMLLESSGSTVVRQAANSVYDQVNDLSQVIDVGTVNGDKRVKIIKDLVYSTEAQVVPEFHRLVFNHKLEYTRPNGTASDVEYEIEDLRVRVKNSDILLYENIKEFYSNTFLTSLDGETITDVTNRASGFEYQVGKDETLELSYEVVINDRDNDTLEDVTIDTGYSDGTSIAVRGDSLRV